MKVNKRKSAVIAIACAAVLGVFALSYEYSNDIDNSNTLIQTACVENDESGFLSSDIKSETASIGDYELNINEFTVLESPATSNEEKAQIGVVNNYGVFFVESGNDKVKKYKYGNYDASKKYLIKGTADFSKLDVTFEGYFLVDETLSGYKKGQVLMYRGEFTFPNGDRFNGTVSSGKYYSSGTYTWNNGQSYKGKFTTSNKLGTTYLTENKTEEYGYFYFDSTKKNYLFIRFVNGIPRETGYYVMNGIKYTVKFNRSGKCIYTQKTS